MEDNKFEVLIIMSVISTIAFFVLKDIFKTHTQFMDFMRTLYVCAGVLVSAISAIGAAIALRDREIGICIVCMLVTVLLMTLSMLTLQQIGVHDDIIPAAIMCFGGFKL